MEPGQFGKITRDSASTEFFDAAVQGQLVLPQCRHCAAWQPLTTQICTACDHHDLIWSPASGRGSVVTWTIVPDPTVEPDGQRVMVLIELHEGPWLVTRLVGDGATDVRHAMPVTISFVTPPGGEPLPLAIGESSNDQLDDQVA